MKVLDLLRRLRPDPRAHAETVARLIDDAACERERARQAMADWRIVESQLDQADPSEREPTRNDAIFDLWGRPPRWRDAGDGHAGN